MIVVQRSAWVTIFSTHVFAPFPGPPRSRSRCEYVTMPWSGLFSSCATSAAS